jgi:integrase
VIFLPVDALLQEFHSGSYGSMKDCLTIKDLRRNKDLRYIASSWRKVYIGDASFSYSPPADLDDRISFFKSKFFAPKTWSNYKSRLESYFLFCLYFDTPFFPLTGKNLARYAVFLANSFSSPDSIASYVSTMVSLQNFIFLDEAVPLSMAEVRLVTKGIRRFFQHRVNPVDALLLCDLKAMSATIDLKSGRQFSFWLIVLIGWMTFSRIGSLLPQSALKFSPICHMTRSDIKIVNNELLVSLRFSKTRQFNDSLLVFPIPSSSSAIFNIVGLWRRFIDCHPSDHLDSAFTFLSFGKRKLHTYNTFVYDLKQHCFSAGIKKRIRAHSLRRGGASTALKAGVNPLLIKLMGDWSSDCYMRYLEVDVGQRREVATKLTRLF